MCYYLCMQKRKTTTFHLTVSHYKILQTVNELNKVKKYPTAKGINNILQGKLDVETRKYIDLKTFGTLLSYPGRRLCSYILNMVRRGYLSYIYDKASDNMYLRITEKGEIEVFNFEKKHKNEYTKKEAHRKAQIVEIK